MQDFKQLKVWEKSHALTLAVYLANRGFPKEELYGLTSQLRRAVSSIPANIAEGCGRNSGPEVSIAIKNEPFSLGGSKWVAVLVVRWQRM